MEAAVCHDWAGYDAEEERAERRSRLADGAAGIGWSEYNFSPMFKSECFSLQVNVRVVIICLILANMYARASIPKPLICN